MLVPVVLFPTVSALRRTPPDERVVYSRRTTAATEMEDFQNLNAFYSELDIARIRKQLKRIKVRFRQLGGNKSNLTTGNMSLPTGSMSAVRGAPQRCAIVASSQNVLNSRAREDIDAVDGPVMRMNLAVTTGYEKFVGSRTEVLLVNDVALCWLLRYHLLPEPGVKQVMINGGRKVKRVCLNYLAKVFPQEDSFVVENVGQTIRGIDKVLDLVAENGPASLRRLTKPTHATSGLVGGLLLMNMCKEVLHYGFLQGGACQEHYWEDTHNCSTDQNHLITREHMLWKLISTTRRTNFTGEGIVRGWPRLQTEG